MAIFKSALVSEEADEARAKLEANLPPLRIAVSGDTGILGSVHNSLIARLKEGIKLIGEIEYTEEDYSCLKNEVRRVVASLGPEQASQMIWEQTPGAAAAYLVMAGIFDYTQRDYWQMTFEPIGITSTTQLQRYWGSRFLRILITYNLTLFDEDVLKYVGRILGHAMIPNECLPEFFGHLLEPAVRSYAWVGTSDKDIIGRWLTQPGTCYLIDVPVWQFLKHGEDRAERLVTAALRMAREHYGTGEILDADVSGLSHRIVKKYEEWLSSPAGRRALPRSPHLKLDPVRGCLLVFPDQILPDCRENQVCFWEVSIGDRRFRGPSDFAVKRNEDVMFYSSEMAIPPIGPYDIKLRVGNDVMQKWTIEGMNSQPFWRAFSKHGVGGTHGSRHLQAKLTWFLVPSQAALFAYCREGTRLKDSVQRRHMLSDDWSGFESVLMDLTSAVSIEIRRGKESDVVNIEHDVCEVILKGGQLLQSAEISSDHVALYGDPPPDLIIKVFPGTELEILQNLKIRFEGSGFRERQGYWPSKEDLRLEGQIKSGTIRYDLRGLLKGKSGPGDLLISVWVGHKRYASLRFRWVPGLKWDWSPDGRKAELWTPKSTTLFEIDARGRPQVLKNSNREYSIGLPPKQPEINLKLSWRGSGVAALEIPLRLCGPRWAFLKRRRDIPIWYGKPIEIMPGNIAEEEENPIILFEARDMAWHGADLSAKLMDSSDIGVSEPLSIEHIEREARWLITLKEGSAFIEKSNNTSARVIVTGTIPGFGQAREVRLCVMILKRHMEFQWALDTGSNEPPKWGDFCLDLCYADVLEWVNPFIVFRPFQDELGTDDIYAYWWSEDARHHYCELPIRKYSGQRKWAIYFSPALEIIKKDPVGNSEIKVELRRGLGAKEGIEMSLARFRRHPHAFKTFPEWANWANGNRLREFSLDLLCELSPNYWAPIDLLATEMSVSPEIIRLAFSLIMQDCQECFVSERQDCYRISRESYRAMRNVLQEWLISRELGYETYR